MRKLYNLKKKQHKNNIRTFSLALKRVEKLTEMKLLEIPDITYEPRKGAYADTEFIKILLKEENENHKVLFITEDRDLRIRLSHLLKTDNITINRLQDVYVSVE